MGFILVVDLLGVGCIEDDVLVVIEVLVFVIELIDIRIKDW